MLYFENKKAFTLVEVLVTLGIIGVVSALTLPNVMTNYKNKVYVAELQRICNVLSGAAERLMKDEEVDNMSYTSLFIDPAVDESLSGELYQNAVKTAMENFFNSYFKVKKLCGFQNDGCYGTEYKGLNRRAGVFPLYPSEQYCAKVDTGATVCISSYKSNQIAEVSIDTNGPKAPNVLGRDAFTLKLDRKGTIRESANGLSRSDDCAKNYIEYGVGCFDRIVKNGWKMDY